jgi:hypothetical protein
MVGEPGHPVVPIQGGQTSNIMSARTHSRTTNCNSFLMHLRALLKKNFLLKKRAWKTTLFEIFLPVLLVLALIGLRAAIKREDKPVSLQLDSSLAQNVFPRQELALMTASAAFWNYKIALIGDSALRR